MNPMIKSYRAELKQIHRQRRKIITEHNAFRRAMELDIRDDGKRLCQYTKEHQTLVKAIRKDIARSERDCQKQLTRINKRAAILKGRINS